MATRASKGLGLFGNPSPPWKPPPKARGLQPTRLFVQRLFVHPCRSLERWQGGGVKGLRCRVKVHVCPSLAPPPAPVSPACPCPGTCGPRGWGGPKTRGWDGPPGRESSGAWQGRDGHVPRCGLCPQPLHLIFATGPRSASGARLRAAHPASAGEDPDSTGVLGATLPQFPHCWTKAGNQEWAVRKRELMELIHVGHTQPGSGLGASLSPVATAMHPPGAVPSPGDIAAAPSQCPAWPRWHDAGAEPHGGQLLPAPGSPGPPPPAANYPVSSPKGARPAGSSPAARSPPPPLCPHRMPGDGNRRCSGRGMPAVPGPPAWRTGPCRAPTPSRPAVRKKGCGSGRCRRETPMGRRRQGSGWRGPRGDGTRGRGKAELLLQVLATHLPAFVPQFPLYSVLPLSGRGFH